MNEDKELTIEEMRSLVTLSTLLPALLDKIASIDKQVGELKSSFNDIKNKFNNNTTAVIEYKRSIDELLQNQNQTKNVESELNTIKEALMRIEASLSFNNTDAPKPAHKKSQPKQLDQPSDEVINIVDKILADQKGRRTRTLTKVNIKTGFKCSDEVAAEVLDWLEKKKMYNTKTHILTFPKN